MQPNNNPVNTVQWFYCAPPKTACVAQAVLMSAVAAVVLEALINLVWELPVIAVHLAIFMILLPAILWLRWRWHDSVEQPNGLSSIEFGEQGVRAQISGQSTRVALEVLEASRHFGALTLKLKSVDCWRPSTNSFATDRFELTIWKAAVDKEVFRKISVLAFWHVRRAA